MRKQYQMIWTSSYDRGLERLLDMWPSIKKEVPEAELVVTYGWELFDAAHGTNMYNPERMAWKEVVNRKMKQGGITHLGRVGQEKMVELLKEAALWAYPTNFDEISCISAMKAQVYGAIPVTSKVAALKETVKFGELVPGDIDTPKVKEFYVKVLCEWLKDGTKQAETRKIMCEEARKLFSWESVAKDWDLEFKKPRVYTKEWATSLFESLPKELQKDEYKAFNI